MRKLLLLFLVVSFHGALLAAGPRYGWQDLHFKKDSVTYDVTDKVRKTGFFKSRGYCGVFEMGFLNVLPTDSSANTPMFSAYMVNGGHINPYFAMGVGVGLDVFSIHQYDLNLTLDFRYQFTRKKPLVPYLDMPYGYVMHLLSDHLGNGPADPHSYYVARPHSGFVCFPSAGIRYALTDRFAVSAGFTYKFMLVIMRRGPYDQTYFQDFHGLGFRTGIHF